MRAWHSGLLALLAAACAAQWQVPTSLVLDGADGADRQVRGLGAPEGGSHGAAVQADRSTTTNFAAATGVDAIAVLLSPALPAYTAGLRITFVPAGANTGDATLEANGLGAVPLRKNINAPLDSGDLHAGIPVQVIYDGTAFQVTSQVYPGCPPGYLPVSTGSCVEAVSHEPVNWYSAVSSCTGQGRRLCGFAEWVQSCLQSTGSIFGSIADYEWVDEASNNINDAKTMGINATTLLPDCRAGGTREPLTMLRYRCCYDR